MKDCLSCAGCRTPDLPNIPRPRGQYVQHLFRIWSILVNHMQKASLDIGYLASVIVMGNTALPSGVADVILHNLNNAIHGNVQEWWNFNGAWNNTTAPDLQWGFFTLKPQSSLSLFHYCVISVFFKFFLLDLLNCHGYLYCCRVTENCKMRAGSVRAPCLFILDTEGRCCLVLLVIKPGNNFRHTK